MQTQPPFKVCASVKSLNNFQRKSTRYFVYEDQDQKPFAPLLANERENLHPNTNCRVSMGFTRPSVLRNSPRFSLTTRFAKKNFASPQALRRISCARPQWSPFEIKKIELERKYETTRRSNVLPNPSFVISPGRHKVQGDSQMKDYFTRKVQMAKKYTDMINRLKMEEAEAISHAVSRARLKQNTEISDLDEALDNIKEEYGRTINLIQHQKVIEEEELLRKYTATNKYEV